MLAAEREKRFFQERLDILKGLDYDNYDTKASLIKENLKNINLLLVKSSYLEKRGFEKVLELRYNNSGFADEFGIGESELFSVIDDIVRDYELHRVIYVCITTMDKDTSFIGFYV